MINPAGTCRSVSPNIVVLGYVSMLTALSSAMIYGLLPVFLVRVLGLSVVTVGLIEGMAEATNSLIKIVSGAITATGLDAESHSWSWAICCPRS
jgi:hypothetical protein